MVGVEIIVCKDDGTYYRDYEFVKTCYPEHENLALDALMSFGENLESDDVIHLAVLDVKVAEPDVHMKEVCDEGNTECPECPHFAYCFD